MTAFNIVNRSPDGSTYFSELGMGGWLSGTIVKMVSNTFNGVFTPFDFLEIRMAAVPDFPQLFFACQVISILSPMKRPGAKDRMSRQEVSFI